MAVQTLTRRNAETVRQILDLPEIAALIADFEGLRWTGRKGYPIRSVIGALLVRSLYGTVTWKATEELIADDAALRDALGAAPSVYAIYRFLGRILKCDRRKAILADGFARLFASLRERFPRFGSELAIDATDIPGYANGQRYVSKHGPPRERYSDPDASWGHRSAISTRKGGGFYGYKVHLAVCADTELPVACYVETARANEAPIVPLLLEIARAHGFAPRSASMDKGYDVPSVYDACEANGIRPIIPIRQTEDVKRGDADPPVCIHGRWKPCGTDYKHKRTKWRCPTGECQPGSKWLSASRQHPLIPRETKQWRRLYKARGAVERVVGRLKNDYGMAPLRTRRLARVALHVDLCILTQLSYALARAPCTPRRT